MPRKVTPTMIREMKRLRRDDLTYRQIANRLNLSESTVYIHLKKKSRFVPHKPEVFFEIVLVLIMSSSVLIIPTADKVLSYQDKYSQSQINALNATDNNVKTFWEGQAKIFKEKTNGAELSLGSDSTCAILSVFGVLLYLDKRILVFRYMASFATALFLLSMLYLTISVIG